MNKLLIILSIIILSGSLNAQILIGLTEDEILNYMEEKHPNYNLNTGFGSTENTVKFYDSTRDRTFIFFLDDKGVCEYSKLMLDMEEYDKTVSVMNNSKSFITKGEHKWIQKKGNIEFVLTIDKTKWMFSLVTQKKKKRK